MKNIKLFLVALIFASVQFAHASYIKPFFELQTGILASNASVVPVYGVRGGLEHHRYYDEWDFTVGYWAARGMSSDQIISGGLNLHTVDLEIERVFTIYFCQNPLRFKIGGGIGYSIPNLDGGAPETADNGHSWLLGGGLDYALNDNTTVGTDIKGFFFTTDTHVTTFGSHIETLSTGDKVEVLDVGHYDNSVNFSSVLARIILRWR